MDLTPQQRAVVDELGELQRRLDEVAPARKRVEKLQKTIASWCAGKPPEESLELVGSRYIAQVSPQRNESSALPTVALYRRLGQARFFSVVKVLVTKLRPQLTPAECEAFIHEGPTGSRTVATVPLLAEKVVAMPAGRAKGRVA